MRSPDDGNYYIAVTRDLDVLCRSRSDDLPGAGRPGTDRGRPVPDPDESHWGVPHAESGLRTRCARPAVPRGSSWDGVPEPGPCADGSRVPRSCWYACGASPAPIVASVEAQDIAQPRERMTRSAVEWGLRVLALECMSVILGRAEPGDLLARRQQRDPDPCRADPHPGVRPIQGGGSARG